MNEPIHRAILPIALTNGNDGRGHRWYKSDATRKTLEACLRSLKQERAPFEQPVRLELVRILGKGQRHFDADSVGRGNAKELIDSLVAVGWFHDDGYRWIKAVTYSQDDSRRHAGPAVEIRVYSA